MWNFLPKSPMNNKSAFGKWMLYNFYNIFSDITNILTEIHWGVFMRIILVISQLWFRQWLGAVRQQAIAWTNADPDLLHHVHSLASNTLRQKKNGADFANVISKLIFLNENGCISIKISPKFILKVTIDNNPALVQIMAWCQKATSHYLN